jgi:hypothetical protein
MNLEGKYVTVTTQEECEAVQKKAFELGYSWNTSGVNILNFDNLSQDNSMSIVFFYDETIAYNFSQENMGCQIPLQTLLSL